MGDTKSPHPSLRWPLHGCHDAEADPAPSSCSWVLLDMYLHIADCHNSTSACAQMSHGEQIRVTFCAATPPRVSYVCVWWPGVPPSEVRRATVEAAECDLLLLRVTLHAPPKEYSEFLVYKASSSKGPSLRPVPMPKPCTKMRYNFGLLAHRDVIRFRPHEKGDDHYFVAALRLSDTIDTGEATSFDLWLYNSTDEKWVTVPISVAVHHCRQTAKVIVMGQGGQLGFVDPWQNIIFCDVLGRTPPTHLPVPKQLIRRDMLWDEPQLYRDVALIDGCLTLVDLRHLVPAAARPYVDRWTWEVSAWTISVSSKDDDWCCNCVVQSGDILVDEDTDNACLLPTMNDREGRLRPTLERLYIAHPMLSLADSHVVYIMGTVGLEETDALLLSIDMRKRRLQGVAMFDAHKMFGLFSYTCIQSRIPGYFNPGAKGNLKRPGHFDVPYPYKLRDRINMMNDLSGGVDEEHQDDNIMDLD